VRVERVGSGHSVLTLTGELDLSTVPKLERPLFGELGSKAVVVLDLTGVSFIDSSGIGLLVKAFRDNREGGSGRLHTVVAARSQVDRVFQLAGIERALPLHRTRAAALASLDGQPAD